MRQKWRAAAVWAGKRTGGNSGGDTQRQSSDTVVQLLASIVLTDTADLQNGAVSFPRWLDTMLWRWSHTIQPNSRSRASCSVTRGNSQHDMRIVAIFCRAERRAKTRSYQSIVSSSFSSRTPILSLSPPNLLPHSLLSLLSGRIPTTDSIPN